MGKWEQFKHPSHSVLLTLDIVTVVTSMLGPKSSIKHRNLLYGCHPDAYQDKLAKPHRSIEQLSADASNRHLVFPTRSATSGRSNKWRAK